MTVTDTQGQIPAIKLLNNSMDRLRDCLLHSLRRNDVVSRFSATQFVVMLSSLTFENSLMVQDRILGRFKRENPGSPCRFIPSCSPWTPSACRNVSDRPGK